MNLDIVYQDECLLVLNKPAGIPVHATHDPLRPHLQGVAEKTLGTKLVLHHRLDRDTTGLVIFGIDPTYNKAMTDLFRDRSVKKDYWAVVDGLWLDEWKRVDTYIDKIAGGRWVNVRGHGGKNAKPAHTEFRVLGTNSDKSWIEASPLTGRTHQIRLHCLFKNHPILGDVLYHGQKGGWKYPMALHARRLVFRHPKTGQELRLEAPPPDYWEGYYLRGLGS